MTQGAAELLARARKNALKLAEIPEPIRPKSAIEAYAAQADVVRRMIADRGGEVIGYKIACTNALAQRQLSVAEPFYGHLISHSTFESPARIPASRFSMRVIEAEFAFRLAKDLPPGTRRTRDEIADAIEGVLPGIEIVDSRYESWTTVGVISLIVDNACHGAYVKGGLVRDWRGMDLAAQAVRLIVNGKATAEGSGAAVLGHPLNAFQWLVERLNGQGIALRAGQYVTTGVTTGVYEAQAGDRIEAEFGPVGRVAVEFE